MFKVGVEMLMSPGSWGWLGLDNSTGQADLMIIFHLVIGKKFFILVHRTLSALTQHKYPHYHHKGIIAFQGTK